MSTTTGLEDPRMKLAGVMVASQVAAGQTDIEDDEHLGEIPENVAKVGGIAADRLRSLVERWERLDEEVKTLREDQKDILAEARSAGFDVKVMRQLFAIRKKDAKEVEEQTSLLDVYKHALGME